LRLNLSLRSLNIVVITTNCKVGNTIEGMQQMQHWNPYNLLVWAYKWKGNMYRMLSGDPLASH